MNPAFLGHRQQHLNCSATTAIDFKPESENEKAGLLIFQNEEHFYFICKSLENNKEVIQLYKSGAADEEMELITSREISNEQNENLLYLEIKAEGNKYSFFYSKNKHELDLLKEDVDAMFLSTRVAGGFVGCMFAFYATSLGKESNNKAYFDFFNYEGNDEVYKK